MSIGQTLTAAREAAGLSVDDVSRITRVRGGMLCQIERDDFSSCGGQIYARGHIRNIAVAVGIDPAPLLAEFDGSNAAVAPEMQHILEREETVRLGSNGPHWTAAMFVAAAVLFIVAVVSLTNGGRGPADSGILGEPPPGDVPVTTSASPSPSPGLSSEAPEPARTPSAATPPVVAVTGVNVRVSITGSKSWVQVRDADTKAILLQEVMSAGQVKDFKVAKKMSMVLGNAGAVRLVVNGRNIGAPGGPGQVVRVSFGPGDPAAG